MKTKKNCRKELHGPCYPISCKNKTKKPYWIPSTQNKSKVSCTGQWFCEYHNNLSKKLYTPNHYKIMNVCSKNLNFDLKNINNEYTNKNKSNSDIGIELEICVKNDNYEEMSEYELKISNNKYGELIYNTDPSCMCGWTDDWEPAEIISPKMNINKINMFLDHIFDKKHHFRKNSIKQGGTCGIHIHWSNKKLFKKLGVLDNPDKMFYLVNNFRILNLENKNFLESVDFSGRHRDNIYDSGISNVNDFNKLLKTVKGRKINFNNKNLKLNEVMEKDAKLYVINPIFKYLSDRNLKIFCQLLNNNKPGTVYLKQSAFNIESNFSRVKLENKVKELIKHGKIVKDSCMYKTDSKIKFKVNIDGTIWEPDNEAVYVCSLLDELIKKTKYVYKIEPCVIGIDDYKNIIRSAKKLNSERDNILIDKISDKKMPII